MIEGPVCPELREFGKMKQNQGAARGQVPGVNGSCGPLMFLLDPRRNLVLTRIARVP